MAVLSTAIAAAGLALGVGGAITGNKKQKQSAGYQREAAGYQQKQANLQNARAKRDAVREARMAYGQAQNAAANQGVSGSSSSLGGLSSIAAQARDNVSFLDKYGFLSDQASTALGKAGVAQSQANTYGAISNLGFTAFGNAEGIANTFGRS